MSRRRAHLACLGALTLAGCTGLLARPAAPGGEAAGAAIAASATLDQVIARYEQVKLLVAFAQVFLPPATAAKLQAIQATIDRHIAAARTAATLASQAAALADARAALLRLEAQR